MSNLKEKTGSITTEEWMSYIRFFFNVFVLGFISIIISGKLLTQIPACKIKALKGKQIMNINILILRLKATDDEVIIGLAAFLSVLFIIGLFVGDSMKLFFNNHYGTELSQFETICIFSSFCTLFISFILKVLLSSKNNDPYDKNYNDMIDKLSKKE
jgi:hypothetical protein